MDDVEREKREDSYSLESLVKHPGSKVVFKEIEGLIDRHFSQLIDARKNVDNVKFHAGAIRACHELLVHIYGGASYGERCRILAEAASRQEMEHLGEEAKRKEGLPRPVRFSRDAV